MNEPATIQSKIYEVRGQRVMLDFDLAGMYGVETRVLNQAVKRKPKPRRRIGFIQDKGGENEKSGSHV